MERLVVVELEERQIHAVAVDDADADEQVHQVRDLVLLLQHALVELAAGHARHAAEDDHERFAPELRLLDGARQVVVDPARRRGEGLHVLHHLVLGVGGPEVGGEERKAGKKGENGKVTGLHGSGTCEHLSAHHPLGTSPITCPNRSRRGGLRSVDKAARRKARERPSMDSSGWEPGTWKSPPAFPDWVLPGRAIRLRRG